MFRALLVLALWTAAGPLVAFQKGRERPGVLDGGDVRELRVRGIPGARKAFFLLRADDGEGQAVGVARWVTGGGRGFGEHRAELEVCLFEQGVRFHHVERIRPAERKLVWREVRPRGGRTLVVAGAASHGFTIQDHLAGEVRRRVVRFERAWLPLELVEAAARGADFLGSFEVFQPLSGAFEELLVDTRSVDRGGERERELVLRRPDGTRVGRYRFRRGELVEFGWTEGGPLARPIPPAQYRERLARLETPPPPLPEPELEATPLLDGPHPLSSQD